MQRFYDLANPCLGIPFSGPKSDVQRRVIEGPVSGDRAYAFSIHSTDQIDSDSLLQ